MNGFSGISKRCWIAGTAAAGLGLFTLGVYLRWSQAMLHSWMMLAAIGLLSVLGAWLFNCADKRLQWLGICLGGLFVFLQVAAERLEAAGTLAAASGELIWMLVCVAGLTPAAGGAFGLFAQLVGQYKENSSLEDRSSTG